MSSTSGLPAVSSKTEFSKPRLDPILSYSLRTQNGLRYCSCLLNMEPMSVPQHTCQLRHPGLCRRYGNKNPIEPLGHSTLSVIGCSSAKLTKHISKGVTCFSDISSTERAKTIPMTSGCRHLNSYSRLEHANHSCPSQNHGAMSSCGTFTTLSEASPVLLYRKTGNVPYGTS